jgi:hypothetical protein
MRCYASKLSKIYTMVTTISGMIHVRFEVRGAEQSRFADPEPAMGEYFSNQTY